MKINMVCPEKKRDRSSTVAVVVLVASLMLVLLAAPVQAAIVYISQSSAGNNLLPTDGSAGPLTIPKPTGVSAGRALIASVAVRPTGMTITVPAGWILMTATNQPAGGVSTAPGGMTLLTYYKIATASEPANYTWTFANPVLGQGGGAVGGILAFSGVDTSASPIDVWSARLTPNGFTHATNSITPTVTNTLIVSSISYLSASSFANPTGIAGIVERLDVSAPAGTAAIGTTIQMATAPWATTTATGASSAVAASFADTGVGHLMALKPSNVDLAMVMTRSGPLIPGGSASYTLTVTNNGPNSESGPLTVVDTLPVGLTYASFSGSGWTCGAIGQVVTCTRPGALAAGATAPALVLNVNVDIGASGTLTNTATVSGIGGDGNLANNTAVDSYTIPSTLALGFCEGFESGLGNWTIASGGGDAGTSTATAGLGSSSMFLRWGVVTVTLDTIDTTAAASGPKVTAWIRRGDDTFSEDPDAGEDLVVEYLNNVGTWVALETFPGNGTAGEILTRTYVLGVDAVHAGFQLRFRQTAGNGSDFDYWHVDDVCVLNSQVTYYAMDEASWSAAPGQVIDSSGNNNHATALGGITTFLMPASGLKGDTCRGTNIPDNNAAATIEAVDTGIDINSIGNAGTISFWYRSRLAWNPPGNSNNDHRTLFDATPAGGNGEFWFVLRKNGRLRFRLDNASNNRQTVNTGTINRPAGTWVHVAATWNFPTDTMCVYVDGVSAGCRINNNVTSSPNYSTLYVGDNRGFYTNNANRGNSADGDIDELRIYSSELNAAAITTDMNAAHSCTAGVDHYALTHSGNGVNCQAEPVTITAHDAPHAAVNPAVGTVITLSTSTGLGDWAKVSGPGGFANGAANDGIATYTFTGAENNVGLTLKHTAPAALPNVNINVTDGTVTETSGTATAAEDLPLPFAPSGFRFTDGTNPVIIGTQIAGKQSNVAPGAQSLFLQAIRTDTATGACVGVFAPATTVNIDLASQCNNPTTCIAGQQVRITNNSIITAIASNPDTGVGSYTSVPLLFGANSQAPISFNYTDVGQIGLHARYNIPLGSGGPSATNMLGSSNQFVVKPSEFALSNIVRTADSFANPGAADETGARFIGAGQPFTATVTATNTLGNPTPNYGREIAPEGVLLTSNLAGPIGGNNPPLTNGSIPGSEFGAGGMVADANGVATVTNLSWSEVGIITLTPGIGDSDYLGAGDVTGTVSGNIGRFSPDHFDVTVTHGCSGGATFTYSGQPFTVTATARNAGGAVTLNYHGAAPAYAKPTTFSNAGDSTNFTNNTLVVADYVNGVGTRNNITYTFPSAETVPVTLAMRAIDAPDNVSSSGFTEETTEVRSGRVMIQNAFGSELLDLPMSLTAQFYDAAGFFKTNLADSCTNATLLFENPQGNLALADTCVLDNGNPGLSGEGCGAVAPVVDQFREGGVVTFVGDFNLTLQAPGANNEGSLDVTVDLDVTGHNWLKYDWTGGGPSNPVGRANFGVYKGSPQHIYRREIFQ